MAKKTTPIITHTEILARAIRTIEAEIDDWVCKCSGIPNLSFNQRDVMIAQSTEQLRSKLDALKEMYRFETGTEYI